MVKTSLISPPPRVLVTGVGLVTGLGPDAQTSWRALRAGRSAARWLDSAAGPGAPPFAGFPVGAGDRGPLALALRAAREALADAGHGPFAEPERVATIVGTSKGDLDALAADRTTLRGGGRVEGPDGWLRGWPSSAASGVAGALGLRGPCIGPVAACATGLVAAARGADLIRRGVCDVALAGAADASLGPFALGALRRMGVLARLGPGGDPARAVRPWDADRSGFLVGEGAAVLVLERADHARARGALPYAEFAGGALGGDAHHVTDLDPDPANLAGLILRALAAAGVDAAEVDHVNVHGTATRSNDPLECRAIRRALGAHAGSVACSANKGQVGHTLGAAGAVELAFTCLAVRDAYVPPTLNLDRPDPACDLDGTPHVGRPKVIRAALKLSMGFGGHLAAAVLRRADLPRREAGPA